MLHTIVNHILKKGKKDYDPNNRPDYVKARKGELKRPFFMPVGVKRELIFEEGLKGEYYTNKSARKDKIILYIHGGGYMTGSAESRRDFAASLCKKSGYSVYSIDYPLAPEEKFPKGQLACFESYKILDKRYRSKNISIIGESAGGGLVASTILLAIKEGVEVPSSAVLLSPVLQFKEVLPSYIANAEKDSILGKTSMLEMIDNNLVTEENKNSELANPLYSDTLKDFPPCFISASDCEYLLDDSVIFDKKLSGLNKEHVFKLYHNMMHAFQIVPYYKESKKSMKEVISFIQEHMK